ncbi:molecular chaperone isoform B [Chlorella sorokiniana]|uniref:Molecular chaperone isoform B n=1 Tax=Chlorella sorokiniana TaxID=3076 RepID=A0A2P6U480_CHLSO|nr:molecular chaperone isoform B [Chlorella sorokiniana]|eukprot:PRW61112.1 molecular chaperone isoform B [Chlorella sorokiniana]
MQDPWAVMGVTRQASQDEIKEQWRRLCKQHHPDLQPAHMRHQAEQYFKEISSAYRTLTARGSSLAAYADFTAAQAAAARTGHPYAEGFRTAWSPGGQQMKFSNGVVAAVLFIPLVITGMWMAFTFTEDLESGWRPHGLMAPPENPYLREELKPRVYSHWAKWQEQRRAQAQQETHVIELGAGRGYVVVTRGAQPAPAHQASQLIVALAVQRQHLLWQQQRRQQQQQQATSQHSEAAPLPQQRAAVLPDPPALKRRVPATAAERGAKQQRRGAGSCPDCCH